MDANYTLNALCRNAEKLSGGTFHLDAENRDAVEMLAIWLARQSCDGMDPNRGILLIGNVGSGKTLLMRSASRVIEDAYGVRSFGVKGCSDLVRMFNEDGYAGDIDMWINAPHVCLDDMGTEGEAIHFGKRTNLIGEMIEARYDRAMRGVKAWTHITTNLSTDAIKERYGARVYSRIAHMCNAIGIGVSENAVDRRRNAPAMPLREQQNPDTAYGVIAPSVLSKLHEDMTKMVDAKSAAPKTAAQRMRENLGLTPDQMHIVEKTRPELIPLPETKGEQAA